METLLHPPEWIKPFAEWCAAMVEAIGILIILLVSIYVIGFALLRTVRSDSRRSVLREVRRRLGYGIMLGLEFLVAADIIHTVAVELTLETVSVLAVIVLIRTFLSFTLEVELTGRWPWQQQESQQE